MSEKPTGAGKGDKARNNYSSQFWSNYGEINWGRSSLGFCDCCGEYGELELVLSRTVAGLSACKKCMKKNGPKN